MRSVAVLTMTRDEDIFFPFWLRYISQFFAPQDIHVLNHNSTDEPLEGVESRRVTDIRAADSVRLSIRRMERFNELQENYEYVLFLDVDEIALADPSIYDGLSDYIERCERSRVRLTGRVVRQGRDEPALDFSQPILSQRRSWAPSDLYSKPVLTSEAVIWKGGQHNVEGTEDEADPGLILVHLQKADHNAWRERYARRFGEHYVVRQEAWDAFFGLGEAELEEIPERFRTLV